MNNWAQLKKWRDKQAQKEKEALLNSNKLIQIKILRNRLKKNEIITFLVVIGGGIALCCTLVLAFIGIPMILYGIIVLNKISKNKKQLDIIEQNLK